MRNATLTLLLVPLAALSLWGCGSVDDDDYEAGNRLTITAITDADGNSSLVSAAVEETDDSGEDGSLTTVDEGQNDGWPTEGTPGEAIVTPLSNDLGVISFRNDARLGVEPGVPLEVYRVDITYVDGAGNSHNYAPSKSWDVRVSVPSNGTADLSGVILMPVDIKSAIRNLMVNAHSTNVFPQPWRATVDVYARDEINDDDVHAQGQFSIQFINPMIQG